jgi:hypothetical protein
VKTLMATTFQLTMAEVKILDIEIVGEGGFQSFGRSLQARLDRDKRTINLTDEEIGRVFRYAAYARTDGGFQGRCRKIFGRALSAPFTQQPGLPGVRWE